MADLSKRLRQGHFPHQPIMDEAADEIDRQHAVISGLVEAATAARDLIVETRPACPRVALALTQALAAAAGQETEDDEG